MIEMIVILGFVMSMAHLWKKSGFNPDLIPCLNVMFAMILALFIFNDVAFSIRIQQGVITGLAASGCYDVLTSFKKNS
ncbi:MAG: hypothetical protein FWG67_00640 [Defluviitaleaceae bacterium]|nr:hypothetical protein [Defluviitaleaceae bacterium]